MLLEKFMNNRKYKLSVVGTWYDYRADSRGLKARLQALLAKQALVSLYLF